MCVCVSLIQQLFTGGLVASGTLINTPFPAALFTYFCTCSEMKISKFLLLLLLLKAILFHPVPQYQWIIL